MPDWATAQAWAGEGFAHELTAQLPLHAPPVFRARLAAQDAAVGAPPQVKVPVEHISLLVPLLHLIGQRQDGQLPSRLKVLDIGGSFGAFYFTAQRMCPAVRFDWTVVETPPTVRHLADQQTDALRWADAVDEQEPFDLAFICGTLNYLPDPEATLARCLRQCRHLIVARLPLVEANEDLCFLHVVSRQDNVPAYAGRFLSRPRFVQAITRDGQLQMFYEDPPARPLGTAQLKPLYVTVLARRLHV